MAPLPPPQSSLPFCTRLARRRNHAADGGCRSRTQRGASAVCRTCDAVAGDCGPRPFVAKLSQKTQKRGTQVAETANAKTLSIELTADIASAYVSNNDLPAAELPGLIASIFGALTGAAAPQKAAEPQQPAVPIKKSITADHLICLEDGLKFKSLKRHLRTKYDLSPEAYRAKWGLPKNYPMVAPAYSEARSSLAKEMGLGQAGRRKAAPRTARPKTARSSGR